MSTPQSTKTPHPHSDEYVDHVPLPHLRSLREAVSLKDDWTGLSSAAKRRKIQNRLNQRARRNRKIHDNRQKQTSELPDRDRNQDITSPVSPKNKDHGKDYNYSSLSEWTFITFDQSQSQIQKTKRKLTTTNKTRSQNPTPSKKTTPPLHICQLDDPTLHKKITKFIHIKLQHYLLGSPHIDDLLTLIPFNLYRAILLNAQILKYSIPSLQPDSAISKFYSPLPSPYPSPSPPNQNGNQERQGEEKWSTFPQSLKPTKVQKKIPHHPWLDLFPIPGLRDNLILNQDIIDENELCNQLVGFISSSPSPYPSTPTSSSLSTSPSTLSPSSPSLTSSSSSSLSPSPPSQNGIIIHNHHPWDPSNWEISLGFFNRYKFLFRTNCQEIIASTNNLRARRGEEDMLEL